MLAGKVLVSSVNQCASRHLTWSRVLADRAILAPPTPREGSPLQIIQISRQSARERVSRHSAVRAGHQHISLFVPPFPPRLSQLPTHYVRVGQCPLPRGNCVDLNRPTFSQLLIGPCWKNMPCMLNGLYSNLRSSSDFFQDQL